MPRASLPSKLKSLLSFQVTLTQDTEDQVQESMLRVLEAWKEAREKRAREDDRILQLFFDTNPQLAWPAQAWRSRTEPRQGRQHDFMETGREQQARWTWEHWRFAQHLKENPIRVEDLTEDAPPSTEPPAYLNAPHDYKLCCEVFPLWQLKEGWSDWEDKLITTWNAGEEFVGFERIHQSRAREAWRMKDYLWIDQRVRSKAHQDHAKEPGHHCSFCKEAEANDAERARQEEAWKTQQKQMEEAAARESTVSFEESPPPTPAPEPKPLEQVAHCEICKASFTQMVYYNNHCASTDHKQRQRENERMATKALKERIAELKAREMEAKMREREAKQRERELNEAAKKAAQEAREAAEKEREAKRQERAEVKQHGQRCEGCQQETPFKQVQERHLLSKLHFKRCGLQNC